MATAWTRLWEEGEGRWAQEEEDPALPPGASLCHPGANSEHATPLLKRLQWLPSSLLLEWVTPPACPGRRGGRVLPICSSQLFPGPLDPQCPHEMQPPTAAEDSLQSPVSMELRHLPSAKRLTATLHRPVSSGKSSPRGCQLPGGWGSAVAGGFQQSHAQWLKGGHRGVPRPRPVAAADWQRGPSPDGILRSGFQGPAPFLQHTECQFCGLLSPEPPSAATMPASLCHPQEPALGRALSCSRAFSGSLVLREMELELLSLLLLEAVPALGSCGLSPTTASRLSLVIWLLSTPRLSIRLCLPCSAHEACPPTAPL